MRDPLESPKSYLRCFRQGPHESHEWYFYYDDSGPQLSFCEGGEEKETDGGQAISSSD